jgi:hypothetical protein
MSSIFLAFLFISLTCLAWVFITPRRAVAKTEGHRKPRLTGFIFSFLTILFFVLVGVTAPQNPKTPEATLKLAPARVQTQAQNTVTKRITQTEPIVFTTITKPDSKLPKGQTELLQPGKNGSESLVFSVVYTNGQETSKTLLSQTVTSQQVTEIVAEGTAPPPAQ